MTSVSRLPALSFLASLLLSCSINPFDRSQVPVIDVMQENGTLKIVWSPQGAWNVRVLQGTVDIKDPANTRPPGRGVMWSISKKEHSVTSPVTYGVEQTGTWSSEALPLIPGETYTVYVLRDDPKGSGDGFTNTHNIYEAAIVFTQR